MFSFITDSLESLSIDPQAHPTKPRTVSRLNAPRHVLHGPFSSAQTCVFREDRVIISGFPGNASSISLPPLDRSLAPIAATDLALEVSRTFPNCPYLVFNLSNEHYDYAPFADQVVAYALHKYPAPPFDLLYEIVEAVKGWLEGDDSNACVMHDVSGRRSMVVFACVDMTNQMENDMQTTKTRAAARSSKELVEDALARLRAVPNAEPPIDGLVPSQRRYMNYYATYLESALLGRRNAAYHSPKRLVLQRVIVNGIPDFVNDSRPMTRKGCVKVKCVPFIKIYINGTLIGGTCPDATVTTQDGCFRLEPRSPYPKPSTGSSELNADAVAKARSNVEEKACLVCGDVLVKVFHWAESGDAGTKHRAVPMFSVMFHTGFVIDNVLHLDAEEVDGARRNARFPEDFFVDCFFADEPHAIADNAHIEVASSSGIPAPRPDPDPELQESKRQEKKKQGFVAGFGSVPHEEVGHVHVDDDDDVVVVETSLDLAQTINEIEEILKDAGDVEEDADEAVDFEAFAESLDLEDKDELEEEEAMLGRQGSLDLDEFVSTFDNN